MPKAPRSDRFESLDVLRGLAVLGILMVNVQFFAMIWAAADAPTAHMDFTAAGNRMVWALTHTFFSLKFITLFSALFGAGIVLMLGEGDASHSRHFRRMSWLLLIGLIHAYVFWYGDILVPYALAGMVIVAARRMSVGGLLGLGLGLTGFTGLLYIAGYAIGALVGDTATPAEVYGFTPAHVADIEALFQSGFVDRLAYNLGTTLQFELVQIVFFGGRLAGVMCLGMAAYKSGFLTLGWPAKRYAVSALIACVTGLILCGWSAWHALATEFAPAEAWTGALAQYVGSLVLAFGYAAAVMLACQADWAGPVRRALAATGRMALSNYLFQTLIMTFIFVGFPGLGLFGQVERTGQALIVIAVWGVQIAASIFWLKHYRYGPMEWVWRTLTYGEKQPFKHSGSM